MDGIQIEFDDYGNLIFTADEATRAELKAQVDEGVALLEEAHVILRNRILVYGQDTPKVKTQRRHLDYLNEHWRDDNVFLEWIEHHLCNGYGLVQPEDIGALTDGLLITDGSYEDDGTFSADPAVRIWYYNHYMISAYTDDLIESGRMKWTLHKEDK